MKYTEHFNQLREYFDMHYSKFISKSNSPLRPNINMETVIEKILDANTIAKFNLDTPRKLIAFLETHNIDYRKKWSSIQDSKLVRAKRKCEYYGLFIGMDKDMVYLSQPILVRDSYVKSNVARRVPIPKALRLTVWNNRFGLTARIGKCYVCTSNINIESFECGHIISVKCYGSTKENNLEPICGLCNKSMGAKNLDEFKKLYFNN